MKVISAMTMKIRPFFLLMCGLALALALQSTHTAAAPHPDLPSAAPAGTGTAGRIVFAGATAAQGNLTHLYGIDSADGANLAQVTSGPLPDTHPRFAPDLSSIAFERDDDIYLLLRDGTVRNITNTPAAIERYPSWAANGLVSFSSDEDSADGTFDLWLVNDDGNNRRRITEAGINAAGADEFWSAWTRDGSRLAFASNRDGDFEIYVYSGGGVLQAITTNTIPDEAPAWSWDGGRLAFVQTNGENSDIFTVYADGSQPRNLTNHPSRDYAPVWAPTGAEVAFISNRFQAAALPYRFDLLAVSDLGANVRRLTTGNGFTALSPDWVVN